MKLTLLPNRLVRPGCSIPISKKPLVLLPCHRHYASDKPGASKSNDLLKAYHKSKPDYLRKVAEGKATPPVEMGKMAKDDIFGAWEEKAKKVEEKEEKVPMRKDEETEVQWLPENPEDKRGLDYLNMALDPAPERRWKWEREQVIKAARRGWVISKKDHIRRTERQCRETSPWLKTSIKKLGAVARQMAGKTVDEALLQLRFSKQRVSVEVAKHLEHARDKAIVTWGMGLGRISGTEGKRLKIQLKDGRWKSIEDKTSIYIAQALVNRGPYTKEAEFRARSRTNVLRRPYTSITFLLKEEATRIREYQEKSSKALRKKPFIPLPDRPITQQRQYVLW